MGKSETNDHHLFSDVDDLTETTAVLVKSVCSLFFVSVVFLLHRLSRLLFGSIVCICPSLLSSPRSETTKQ